MEFFKQGSFRHLANPGVESTQLLSPHNSTSTRLTITSVVVEPGAEQPRHIHQTSEQIWIALEGSGTLLLKDDTTMAFDQGDVVRFVDGDVHGFKNTSNAPVSYLSVTSPPIDFSYAYKTDSVP
ncbi:MAG: cupin domain-containing protein [Burkholderiales bacterium]|nr:MAG: cupin domain-containing protein [Betaproteobacteria bacterium]TAG28539.1 MAG: cupin domain-containing protein [Burkholderiales bacterium]